ncbi:response regulator [Xanthomonas albilineans]|uniref:Probable two-component system regulatory protein n=1 Tax=Xanthomonas albilineans (strain GPE PC73 / CFBP 7063) TaxID=380358 RepID=D2UE66_XANAP|nr:response regulator transcription factor [Xanthomonas albilineans]PPU94589.1 DNA-binding response regulator [Xanthomonas albilineans]QHQ28497.1 putative two-component system regulatory protein [Xanthomonas albilineans]CBA16264.1 probable two-component system regulatory protein [Xanthomonas albilineans GPE PC73]
MRILVAEDDTSIAVALRDSLVECGHVVDHVSDGTAADHALLAESYHLLVLDLGLPRQDGLQVLQRLRERRDEIPVLVVTARDAVEDRIHALDQGADDYLIKPFELSEFLARTRALLRRSSSGGVPELVLGQLRINLAGRRVWLQDQPLDLTAREFALLETLLLRSGRVVSRGQLTEALCDWQHEITDNGLDISMHRLRRKLHGTGVGIRTIRGLGYMLEESHATASTTDAPPPQ